PWRESIRVHSAVDRLDADGTRVLGQESTNPPIPGFVKNNTPSWSAPLQRALGNHERHGSGGVRCASSCARLCTITRRTPIMGNGREKRRCLPASNRQPMPIMSSLRVPESGPLTFRSEISQGIARRRVGNLSVDQKEKSARQSKWRACSDDHAAYRFHLKQQRF